MLSVSRFVGLDYHQDAVQICVMDNTGTVLANRSVANDWHAITDVIEDVTDEELGPGTVRAAIECCSGAAHLAEELGIGFQRGGTPSGHPEFAPCLADLIEEYLGRREPSAVGADPPRCMTCPEGCCPGPQRPGR